MPEPEKCRALHKVWVYPRDGQDLACKLTHNSGPALGGAGAAARQPSSSFALV